MGRVRGLEFARVAVPSWLYDPCSGRTALYLAVTRAVEQVWMATCSNTRTLEGESQNSA